MCSFLPTVELSLLYLTSQALSSSSVVMWFLATILTYVQPPLLPHTIPQHFAEIVARYGDRTAVISRHQGRRLTYKELDRESDVLAKSLQDLKGRGVKRGDRVCVMCKSLCFFSQSLKSLGALEGVILSSWSGEQYVGLLCPMILFHVSRFGFLATWSYMLRSLHVCSVLRKHKRSLPSFSGH